MTKGGEREENSETCGSAGEYDEGSRRPGGGQEINLSLSEGDVDGTTTRMEGKRRFW